MEHHHNHKNDHHGHHGHDHTKKTSVGHKNEKPHSRPNSKPPSRTSSKTEHSAGKPESTGKVIGSTGNTVHGSGSFGKRVEKRRHGRPSMTPDQRHKIRAFIRIQNDDGSFTVNKNLASALDMPKQFDMLRQQAINKGYNGYAWGTSLVVAYVDCKLKKQIPEMQSDYNKAKNWLINNVSEDWRKKLKADARAHFCNSKVASKTSVGSKGKK